MYTSYNANPADHNVNDCVVRAIATVLNQSWDRTYIEICLQGYLMRNMPASNAVWQEYLSGKGFSRWYPQERTVSEFVTKNRSGTYLLALDRHVVAVIDGEYFDTWDSGEREILYVWER